jgi:hypothetical protein
MILKKQAIQKGSQCKGGEGSFFDPVPFRFHLKPFLCYDFGMGKSGSKNFVNQFKNTKRQAYVEQRKRVKGTARKLKNIFPGERKTDKNSDPGGT